MGFSKVDGAIDRLKSKEKQKEIEKKVKDIIACNQYKNRTDYKIHDIIFQRENSEKIIVTIKLGHPGLFIGNYGRNIDTVVEEIKKVEDIELRLEEYNPLPVSSLEIVEKYEKEIL